MTTDYTGLLTHQYKSSPRLLAWTAAVVDLVDGAVQAIEAFLAGFDLDTANGAQLDTLGALIGRSRRLPFQPADGWSPVLDDTTYRTLIKAKIILNQWDGQLGNIQELWGVLFPAGSIVITDNQNMTMDVSFTGKLTSLVRELCSQGFIVPRPEGVLINFPDDNFIDPPIIFCYDLNTTDRKGYDLGYWD